MKAQEIIKDANNIRECMTSTHYYDEKYGDLKVADVLLVLEDINYHSEETLLEAIAQLDSTSIEMACEIILEHRRAGYLTDKLQKRRYELDEYLAREDD